MTDPTICANCKHYSPAIYKYDGPVLIDFPAYCWHKPPNEPKLDYVTGGTAWRVPVRCYKKNLGSCADYEFKPLLTIVQDAQRKHWWQK